jgi:hypothetical protein
MKKLLSLTILPLLILPTITMLSCSTSVSEDLKISITEKKVIQSEIDLATSSFPSLTTTNEKVEMLNQFFTGVTIENFENFKVSITAKTSTVVSLFTLTAEPGFLFGTNITIKSRIVSLNLPIKPIPITQELLNSVILEYNTALTPEAKLMTLQKVFSGLTLLNLLNLEVKIASDKITLIANEGFIFGQNKIISSLVITV